MNTVAQFVRTTIVGGLLFLAPIVVLIVILAKAFDYAKKGINAVLVYFPAAYELSAGAATALSVVLVALVCFLAGLLARTVPRGISSTHWSRPCSRRFRPTSI